MDDLALVGRIRRKKLRLYPFCQPDAVDGLVKDAASPMHIAAFDTKDDWFSMASTDGFCRLHIA